MVLINEIVDVTLSGATVLHQITTGNTFYLIHVFNGGTVRLPSISANGMRYKIVNAFDSGTSLVVDSLTNLINSAPSITIKFNSEIDIISSGNAWYTITPSNMSSCDSYYGFGSDGGLIIGAGETVTLTHDVYHDSITIDATGVLITAGYRIFANSIIINNGTISNDGTTGGNGVNAPNGNGTGGTGAPAGTLGGGATGGTGGQPSGAGFSGDSSNPVYSSGGSLFNGGKGAGFTGGPGGLGIPNTVNNGGNNWLNIGCNLVNGRNAAGQQLLGGAGGGGGDG